MLMKEAAVAMAAFNCRQVYSYRSCCAVYGFEKSSKHRTIYMTPIFYLVGAPGLENRDSVSGKGQR